MSWVRCEHQTALLSHTLSSALSPRLHHMSPFAPSTIAMYAMLRISASVGNRPCEVNWKNCSTVMKGRASFTALRVRAVHSATCPRS